MVEDRTGEQYTIHDDKAPIREDVGGKIVGKRFDIEEAKLLYQNFRISRRG